MFRFNRKFNHSKKSFSQCGEDLIIEFLFENILQRKEVFYLDIGAYHPYKLSNTALLSLKGYAGVVVEANPGFLKEFSKERKNCQTFNYAVVPEANSDSLKFYIMKPPTLSTASEGEMKRLRDFEGHQVSKTVHVETITIDELVLEKCSHLPNFVSIDVEGMDIQLVKSMDFSKHKPDVLCVETLTYSNGGRGVKLNDTISFIKKQGYVVYADTYINTIFVNADLLG